MFREYLEYAAISLVVILTTWGAVTFINSRPVTSEEYSYVESYCTNRQLETEVDMNSKQQRTDVFCVKEDGERVHVSYRNWYE